MACTLQATRLGAEETRRAGLEPVLLHCNMHTKHVAIALSVCRGHTKSFLQFYSIDAL